MSRVLPILFNGDMVCSILDGRKTVTRRVIKPQPCISCEGLENEFSQLWDSTIKKQDLDRYGWAANPWVWAIEFERCEKPETIN